jgi:hypothetical protein
MRPVRDRRRRHQVEPVGHHGKVLSRHDELLGVGAEVLVEVGHQAGDPRADGQVGVVASLLADPGAWLDSVLADRLGAALRSLPAGTVRAARLVSRNERGYQVTRVTVDMSVTAPDMATATGAAVATVTALIAAAAADAGSWVLAGLSAEIRPAPLPPAPQPARGRAGSVRSGRLPLLARQPGSGRPASCVASKMHLGPRRCAPSSPRRWLPGSA